MLLAAILMLGLVSLLPAKGEADKVASAIDELPGAFVSTAWLYDNRNALNLRIVQVGGDKFYSRLHIPGAHLLPLGAILDNRKDGPAFLASTERLAAAFGRLGVAPETVVVAYGAAGGMNAARLVWSLAAVGHTRAAVLDGGINQWMTEGRGVVTEIPEVAPVDFKTAPNPGIHADWKEVKQASKEGSGTLLLDTRSAREYEGSILSRTKGHVPGAVHLDWLETLEGRRKPLLKETSALKKLFAQVGLHDANQSVIAYCTVGFRAAHTWLLLRQLGFSKARLYDGSMAAWEKRGLPTVKGASPR